MSAGKGPEWRKGTNYAAYYGNFDSIFRKKKDDVVEQDYTIDLKSIGESHAGSNPAIVIDLNKEKHDENSKA